MGKPLDPKLLREFSGMNQTEFWDSIGITQSGGSRYEAGERRLPKPVLQLLRLKYIDKVDLEAIRRHDMELIAYLKSEDRALYAKLRHRAALWHRRKQP